MKRLLIIILLPLGLIINQCAPTSGNHLTPPTRGDSLSSTEILVDTSEIAVNVDRYLSALQSMGFSGAIIVSKGDQIILRNGYGLADRESRRPYTPSTIQSFGSITKQMTAAAILLLESQKKLAVDDTITHYFDDVPKDKTDITIHQLLTHTSGLPGGIGLDEEPIKAQAYVDRLMQEPLQFKPGSNYAYSNSGYTLLGIIVERVSGMGYEEFLRKELLLPAGLKETGYVIPNWDQSRMAVGYSKGQKWGLVYNRGWLDDGPGWHLRANGGIHTTVNDMYLWYKNVMRDHKVLSPETVKRWTTAYVSEHNDHSNYGYGWEVYDHDKWGKVIAHGGSNRIFSADFVWLPEKDLFFYIQGNSSMIAAYKQRNAILSAAFESGFQMPPLVESYEKAKAQAANKREGIYSLADGSLELTADDIRLVAKISGQTPLNVLLDPTEQQMRQFSELNQRTRKAMDKLKAGQNNALAGLMRKGEDPVKPTQVILNRIRQIGNLDSIHVIGSFANKPGSRFAHYGPWTTFIYAEFANWNQYWNFVWNSDATFQGEYSGPWPTFILIPTAANEYTGIRQSPPWDIIQLHFEDGCLVIANQHACKKQ
jgi:CubicO group peptidase (beta-lactamase class C family)